MDRRGYDGPSQVSVEGHLEKNKTLGNRVSDNQNGCAGQTVVGSVAQALAPLSYWTHVTDRRPCDGPSCTTVMLDRDPVSKDLSFFPSVL